MGCSIRGHVQPEGDNSVIGVPFFFFFFLERSRFSCRCSKLGDDGLAKVELNYSRGRNVEIFFFIVAPAPISMYAFLQFHRFLYYRVWLKYGVPGSSIFSFFHLSASGNLPLSQMYREHGSAIGKRTIFLFRKITCPLRM